MTNKMKNAPVYYALSQVQFNTVHIEFYMNRIQDQLRQQGYTLFETFEQFHLQIGHVANQPQVAPQKLWVVSDKDRTAGFILSASWISFHTTHYSNSEAFIPQLVQGLRIVNEVCKLEHISRIGIRYLDAVFPQKGESVDQYLIQQLNRLPIQGNCVAGLNEAVFETRTRPLAETGALVTRVHRRNANLGFPPDLEPHGLAMMDRFKKHTESVSDHAIIDTDHAVFGQWPLDFEDIKEQLKDLKETSYNAFVQMISEHALSVWK